MCCADEYTKALDVLTDALKFGIDPSLDTIRALCAALGNPQDSFKSIQIAGTNGKTSTSRMTAALLRAHGIHTGLYTSPELVYMEERMEVNGEVVSRQDFAEAVNTVYRCARRLIAEDVIRMVTQFELITAAALWLFAQQHVEYAVLEVGMGGRWDATSVVEPVVAVITGIGLDHVAILGNTLEEIAAEKAAIIKPGSIPVIGAGCESVRTVFEQRIEETHTSAHWVNDPTLSTQSAPFGCMVQGVHASYGPFDFLGPAFQLSNSAVSIVAVEAALGTALENDRIQQVLTTLRIPGRFETVCEFPLVIIDAAHNPQSAHVLAETLIARFGRHVPATLLLGILEDKDAEGIIEALVPLFTRIAVTSSASPRALKAEDLAQFLAQHFAGEVLVFPYLKEALDALIAQGESIVATGSITVAGEVAALVAEMAYQR